MNLNQLTRNAIFGQQAKALMQKSGMTMKGYKLWTDEEDEVLRSNYPNRCKMRDELPHRTVDALYKRCATLGMKRARHEWKASELSKLRRLYRKATRLQIMAEFPNVTWNAISTCARYHGIGGTYQHSYLRTGRPIMDALLARLEEIHWNLKDLDEASNTGRYFRNQSWRKRKPNIKFVQLAVQAMDGELKASWKAYD